MNRLVSAQLAVRQRRDHKTEQIRATRLQRGPEIPQNPSLIRWSFRLLFLLSAGRSLAPAGSFARLIR
jgi:hypothetical protein